MSQHHAITALRAHADSKRAEAQRLMDQHSGTRPSWVSTDLALAFNAAGQADREADLLQLAKAASLPELQKAMKMIDACDRASSLMWELFTARSAALKKRITNKDRKDPSQ